METRYIHLRSLAQYRLVFILLTLIGGKKFQILHTVI
jgi:hypothetical protein